MELEGRQGDEAMGVVCLDSGQPYRLASLLAGTVVCASRKWAFDGTEWTVKIHRRKPVKMERARDLKSKAAIKLVRAKRKI